MVAMIMFQIADRLLQIVRHDHRDQPEGEDEAVEEPNQGRQDEVMRRRGQSSRSLYRLQYQQRDPVTARRPKALPIRRRQKLRQQNQPS
jgi:hypothetical protein